MPNCPPRKIKYIIYALIFYNYVVNIRKNKLPPQIKATLRLLSAGGIQLEIMAIEAGISGP